MDRLNKGPKRRIIVDEMDLPILNLGAGPHPLPPNDTFMGPRGPVINIEQDESQVPSGAKRLDIADVGRAGGIPPEWPHNSRTSSTPPPLYAVMDATDNNAMAKLSQTGTFREIHAINPYGFWPTQALPLLANSGVMHVTGQERNKYVNKILKEVTTMMETSRATNAKLVLNAKQNVRGDILAQHRDMSMEATVGHDLSKISMSTYSVRKSS